MASISFFTRLYNLWKGFLGLWISNVEQAHPEIAYENAVNSMTEKYVKLKQATAAIIRRREDIESRLMTERTELKQINADLDTALATNQDDVSLVLLQKKSAIEAELAQLQQEMEVARADADDAKSSLVSVKAEIQKLKAEKDRMLAKMLSAQARIKIQEQVEGLSVDAEVKALDGVRDHIKNTIAQANMGKELAESDLDAKLRAIRAKSGEVSARAQLDALKKARAQTAAGGSKSM